MTEQISYNDGCIYSYTAPKPVIEAQTKAKKRDGSGVNSCSVTVTLIVLSLLSLLIMSFCVWHFWFVQNSNAHLLETQQKLSGKLEELSSTLTSLSLRMQQLRQITELQKCNGKRFIKINSSKCYYIADASLSLNWNAAENYCRILGGHLVTINDAAENDLVFSEAAKLSEKSAWIGLRFISMAGSCNSDNYWTWVENNQAATYFNWKTGQPSSCTQEQCVQYFGANDWNDADCTLPKTFICESF